MVFFDAVHAGDLVTVKRMLADGSANIGDRDALNGKTALLISARYGHYAMVEWLLSEAGSSIKEQAGGATVWYLLAYYNQTSGGRSNFYNPDLSKLLMVMTLLGDDPDNLFLNTTYYTIFEEGRNIRSQHPVYLEQQGALVTKYCPLPTVLLSLVAAYAKPTPEDMWSDWLQWL
jgi:ankyrin repeat protein